MTASWMKSFWIWNSFFSCNFQNKENFPALSYTMIAQLKWKIISLVWIFPEQFITRTVIFFENSLFKIATALPLCLRLGASSDNCFKPFHSGNLVLKLILKDDRRSWFGSQVSYQPRKTNFHHQNSYLQSGFKSSASLLYAYSESWIEVCPSFFFDQRQGDRDFQFKSDHMRKIFRSVLHGLLRAYALRQALSSENLQGASLSRKDYSAMERQNCRGGKAIHHHRADQNPHQRWSLLQRKPALHHPSDRGRDQLFSRASGAAALDAICTHSAEMGFCPEFRHDLNRVCQFL